jgi:rRNA maturation RNase YbeY
MHEGSIQFHNIDIEFSLDHQSKLERWIKSAIKSEGKMPGELDFIFMNDKALLEINRSHLNHDYFTDIITFEYNEGNFVSGDIMISIERVQENAEEFKVNFQDELHRVMIHGVLHLCGYKDKTEAEQIDMRAKEDYYLSLRSF